MSRAESNFTERLWFEQERHPGHRQRLFAAIARSTGAARVLYPGSFVDIAASFVFDDVTYVDSDRRAARFFDDRSGVGSIIARNRISDTTWRFIPGDYTADLGLEDADFDLLVSLYAGFVSEACGRYLRPGGHLLANPSHGDVALASLDDRFQLAAVVTARAGEYVVRHENLDQYLIPRRRGELTAEAVRDSGRGVAYTKSAFAYLFRRSEAT